MMEGMRVVEPPPLPEPGDVVDVEWAGQPWLAEVVKVDLPERAMWMRLLERKRG